MRAYPSLVPLLNRQLTLFSSFSFTAKNYVNDVPQTLKVEEAIQNGGRHGKQQTLNVRSFDTADEVRRSGIALQGSQRLLCNSKGADYESGVSTGEAEAHTELNVLRELLSSKVLLHLELSETASSEAEDFQIERLISEKITRKRMQDAAEPPAFQIQPKRSDEEGRNRCVIWETAS